MLCGNCSPVLIYNHSIFFCADFEKLEGYSEFLSNSEVFFSASFGLISKTFGFCFLIAIFAVDERYCF